VQDMAGNVLEWCNSWDDSTKSARVLRGGCWDFGDSKSFCVAIRYYRDPAFRNGSGGFRCVSRSP